jgi:nickel transport protein
MKKVLNIYLLLIISLLVTAFDAHAHRVTIFAWIDGDTVHTQSKFSGGKMVKNGQVDVFDPEGNLLLKGNTDENGEFSFRVPGKTSLKIELKAGMGHQAEWSIGMEEIGGLEEDDLIVSDQSEEPEYFINPKTETTINAELTRNEIEHAVEKAVEKKLKPVMQMLSELNDPRPKISDIIGGIGYIIGLVGIGAYYKCRKNRKVKNQ